MLSFDSALTLMGIIEVIIRAKHSADVTIAFLSLNIKNTSFINMNKVLYVCIKSVYQAHRMSRNSLKPAGKAKLLLSSSLNADKRYVYLARICNVAAHSVDIIF